MKRQLLFRVRMYLQTYLCHSSWIHFPNSARRKYYYKKSIAFICVRRAFSNTAPNMLFFFLRANWLVVNNNIGDTQHPEEAIVEPLVRMTGYQIHSSPESIEWVIVGQAFSLSYDLAPPINTPLSSVNSTGDTKEDWERETTCPREKGGREAK